MNETPPVKQKPLEITKNKPEVKKRRNLNEQLTRQNRQNDTGMNPTRSTENNPFLSR